MDCTSDFYPNTIVLSYGGNDGDDQRHFHQDLSDILSSCTEGKHHKTFFEVDKEVVKSNFCTLDSFLLFTT